MLQPTCNLVASWPASFQQIWEYKKSLILTTNCNFSAFSGENIEKPLVLILAQITASSVTTFALSLDIYQVFC